MGNFDPEYGRFIYGQTTAFPRNSSIHNPFICESNGTLIGSNRSLGLRLRSNGVILKIFGSTLLLNFSETPRETAK